MNDLKWVPHEQWPRLSHDPARFNVWRSGRFLVQAFHEKNGIVRLSICRTGFNTGKQRFADGIAWDELQAIKSACNYGGFDAVEIYPPDDDVVNVANMRHLWILPKNERLAFAWRRPGHQLSMFRDLLANNQSKEKGK